MRAVGDGRMCGGPTSGVGLADGLADLVDELVGEAHGVGVVWRGGRMAGVAGVTGLARQRVARQRLTRLSGLSRLSRLARQPPFALRQHLFQLLRKRRRGTYVTTTAACYYTTDCNSHYDHRLKRFVYRSNKR